MLYESISEINTQPVSQSSLVRASPAQLPWTTSLNQLELKCCKTGHHRLLLLLPRCHGGSSHAATKQSHFLQKCIFLLFAFWFCGDCKTFWKVVWPLQDEAKFSLLHGFHNIKMYTQEKCVFVKKDSIVTKSMSKVHIITLFCKNLEVEQRG